MQKIPRGLPGGCCRFSTVKEKTRGKVNRPCPHRVSPKGSPCSETIHLRGNGGFGVLEAVPAGAASLSFGGQRRPRLSAAQQLLSEVALGQKRTSQCLRAMSALADVVQQIVFVLQHVRGGRLLLAASFRSVRSPQPNSICNRLMSKK
jgi:hypothetical protein